MRIIIVILILILLSSGKPRPKYLVTITDNRGRIEVLRTNDFRRIDSLFNVKIGMAVPDSLLLKSMFFEIRTEKLTFYCEEK